MTASPKRDEHVQIHHFGFEHRGGVYDVVHVHAGRVKLERICKGEPWERDVERWPVTVEVVASPTGRSVHVHVNGERVL